MTMIEKHKALAACMMIAFAALLVGCPVPPNPDPDPDPVGTYDEGYADGFAIDSWYWDGYEDGWDTIAASPIYYDDSEIDYVESPEYNAGYWDGVWYAYNDGYFVDYHNAFILGFSEGYDNAFWPDYLDFLEDDNHQEFGHGGWVDGYNDGFTEGTFFGANDYEQGLSFDWLDALADYEAGTDIYFEELDEGTGVYGDVFLYEYGVNPNAKSLAKDRFGRTKETTHEAENRPLTASARQNLKTTPKTSRNYTTRNLQLKTSWLDRIQTYDKLDAAKSGPTARLRAPIG